MQVKVPESIDESVEFPELTGAEEVTIDFSQHQYLNSVGIVKWIKWLQDCGASNILLENVSVQFMTQISMISALLSEACEIKSFKMPIYSEELGEEKDLLVKIEQVSLDQDDNVKFDFSWKEDDEASDWVLDVSPTTYFEVIVRQLKG